MFDSSFQGPTSKFLRVKEEVVVSPRNIKKKTQVSVDVVVVCVSYSNIKIGALY